jgi:FkbM family methyltransferase
VLKNLFHKLLTPALQERIRMVLDRYASRSYSQEGEDMILRRLFENRETGFYVDVGAHHPARFSNTYYFYRRGWRGINIDAMPGSMKWFDTFRPRDINLEQAVSVTPGTLNFYVFNEPALNGFDARLSLARNESADAYIIVETRQLKTRRLDTILDEHLSPGQKIDFLSIDVEGFDLEVLESNDWTKYRPEVLLVEVLDNTFPELLASRTSLFLHAQGYEIYAKAVNTVIYRLTSKP